MSLSMTPYVFSRDKDEFDQLLNQSYEKFAKQVREDYVSFRDKVNKEYADFMRSHPWVYTEVEIPLVSPIQKEPEPDIESEEESKKVIENQKAVVIEDVIEINDITPRPMPIEPIEESPRNDDSRGMKLSFYGTPVNIRYVDMSSFRLKSNDESAFADGWERLSQSTTNSLISDCLRIRTEMGLPDWGYIMLLEMISSHLTGENSNEQRLLQGYLLNQSGYKIRFSYDSQRKLHILFASPGIIYGHPRYHLGDDWYYSYTQPQGNEVYICKFEAPGEKAINLAINESPLFDYVPGTTRNIIVKNYPDITLSITPNKNLIDFFNDYPGATLDLSPYSMWAIHGNTPVSKEVKSQLYPSLMSAVEGKSQYEALQFLLKVAQSFPYEYDEKLWGKDRVFWMEESWEYPYSDCEDHAINFSHMVRDILGLDVCLVYYPGHLSSCVALTDYDVKGDFIMYNGKKYIVCDPTYFFSNVGKTAPSNNNAEAILIPLRKLN
ncbi:MAG: hypothetical protein K2M94_06170 [Paramuribaculum sp.]|nr:hypothetical protein [Paramuribaculum sp.]